MNNSVRNIYDITSSVYTGRKGAAFLVILIPMLVGLVLDLILGSIFGEGVLYAIISIFATAFTSYMTVRLALYFIRNGHLDVGRALQFDNSFIKYLGVIAVFAIIQEVLAFILMPLFGSTDAMTDLMVLAETGANIDPEVIKDLFMAIVPYAITITVIMTVIQLKFYVTEYLVIDGEEFVRAFTRSWEVTKGRVWLIIKFYLAIFFFIVAVGVVVGLLVAFTGLVGILILIAFIVFLIGYFIPFTTLMQAVLYEEIAGQFSRVAPAPKDAMPTQDESSDEWDF